MHTRCTVKIIIMTVYVYYTTRVLPVKGHSTMRNTFRVIVQLAVTSNCNSGRSLYTHYLIPYTNIMCTYININILRTYIRNTQSRT